MNTVDLKFWNERWHLAALTTPDFVRIGLVSVIVGMLYVLFHFQGNTTAIETYSRSAFLWMVYFWQYTEGFGGADYSHGWLIPVVSVVVVWMMRHELAEAPKAVSRVGLALVALALFMHWMGAKGQQTRLSLAALILFIWGLPYYLYGWQVAKRLIFPCSYLIFCIPLNFLDVISFPLRLFSAAGAVSILNGLGIEAERSGSAIHTMVGGGFSFDVADPCSGIRSLLALTALTAVYAYFTQKGLIKQWILFLSAIPLAIIGNTARITTIALVAEAFGERIATTLYHDYSGYIVFAVAIFLMVGIGMLLNVDYKEAYAKWKAANLSHTSSSSH